MTGDSKPGDAVADKWTETFEKNRKESDLSLTRLEVRAEQRSENWEEDTGVIHQKAAQLVAAREESEPPPEKLTTLVIAYTVVKKFPAWGSVLVAVAVVAAYVAIKLLSK